MARLQDNKIPDKEQIDKLRREGKTRPEIAEELGISVSRLKRLITDLGVVPRLCKSEERAAAPRQRIREKNVFSNPEEGKGLMDKAKDALGSRMGEKYGSYTLDGRPCSSWDILKAAGLSPKA
jgi:hypothetical protein